MLLNLLNPELYNSFKQRKAINPIQDKDENWPIVDRNDKVWVNIGKVNIKDYFNSSKNDLVHDRITDKYRIGDQVVLAVDPHFKNDIFIIALNGKVLGLLPDEGEFTTQVRRRIEENFAVYAEISDYSLFKSGKLKCEIIIVYYETYFDKRKW